MSRVDYNEWDDEWGHLHTGRWERNSRAVLASKRGQTALRDLREALIALPLKRLAADTFCEVDDKGNVEACVLGAFALHKGIDPQRLSGLNGVDANETADWATGALGLTFTLAWNLVDMNDEKYGSYTPEQRYEAFVLWLNKVIVSEVQQ